MARDLEAAGLTAQFAGDLDPARRYYQQALAIRVTQGRLHPKVSEDLNELGTVAYLQHDPSAAEGYWRRIACAVRASAWANSSRPSCAAQ